MSDSGTIDPERPLYLSKEGWVAIKTPPEVEAEIAALRRELQELRAWVLEVLVRAQGAAPSPVLADAASAAHLRAADEQRARMP